MEAEQIIADWKNKKIKQLYWFDGEEDYFIDKLVHYAENFLLSEADAAFNKTIFYGRDSNWADILNTCKLYSMFAEKRLVIIKEAQHLKEIDKLESYFATPLDTTILIVAYKEKKLDARTRFAKAIKANAVYFSSDKIPDGRLHGWVAGISQRHGYSINDKAAALLVEHIGNDLSRIDNEIEKLILNLSGKKNITEDDIEKYIGISKEYNVFELQNALVAKNMAKALNIIQYFGSNPKAAPIQLILPSLYSFFSKAYMLFGLTGSNDAKAREAGLNPRAMYIYEDAAKKFGKDGIENVLLLLHQYNLKSIGIHTGKTEDVELLKELLIKITL